MMQLTLMYFCIQLAWKKTFQIESVDAFKIKWRRTNIATLDLPYNYGIHFITMLKLHVAAIYSHVKPVVIIHQRTESTKLSNYFIDNL